MRKFLLAALCLVSLPFLVASVGSAQAQGQPSASPATPPMLPLGVAVDPATAAVYVTDVQSHTVRRFTASGALETVAGTGVQGFSGEGGPALQAQLDSPSAVAVDSAGNLYIADTGNSRIRRLARDTGTLTTVAGTGVPGYSGDGGPALQARLSRPLGLAIDAAGNLVISDSGNQRVRRVGAATAVITTIAGSGREGFSGDDGPAGSAALDRPEGIAFNARGDLLIADSRNRCIRLVDHASRQITSLRVAADHPLQSPASITTDASGGLFVADSTLNQVLRLADTGAVAVIAGSGNQGFAGDGAGPPSALLDRPRGIALRPDGSLVVADSGNGRVRVVSNPGQQLSQIETLTGGLAAPLQLVLSGASLVRYGGGTVVVTGSGADSASATVTLFDVTASPGTPVGTSVLRGGVAEFSTGRLTAGTHRLLAGVATDPTHRSVASAPWTLTVTPLPVTASPLGAAMLFGQQPPELTGALAGVLPQDSGRVMANFTSGASITSAPGTYPVRVFLTGAAAADYAVQILDPAAVTVSRAPSTALLLLDPINGPSLRLSVRASTTGVPTGTVILNEAGKTLSTGTLDSAGSFTLDTSGWTAGTHQVSAVYAGDTNFLGCELPPSNVVSAGPPPAPSAPSFDLQPAITGALSIAAGDTATLGFGLTTQGSLPGPIALSVTGLPSFASATFDPPLIPPGGLVKSFVLTVRTAPSANNRASELESLALLCGLAPMLLLVRRRREWDPRRPGAYRVLLCLVTFMLAGCGDRVYTGKSAPGSAPVVYTLVVTGTATRPDGTLFQRTASVLLSVHP